jgi:uncharacterized protein YbjT (DUF2867 family)
MKTLVIGGTGQVGSLVTQGLAAAGQSVRVMSRSKDKAGSLPAGAELVVGDLNSPSAARAAFDGVDAVFMANPVSQTETNEGICGVALAREAGVKKLVYMSVHKLDAAPHLPHFGGKIGIEAAVVASGATWTILRPNNFYQNDVWLKEPAMAYGVYAQPMGDVGLHRVDVRDIADAAVNALTKSGFENKAYALVGPHALTGTSTAEILSAKLGKKIGYGGNDLDAWEKAMSAMMPGWMIFDFKMMYAHFQAKGLLATPAELADCEAVVGHALRSYDAYAVELAKMWA